MNALHSAQLAHADYYLMVLQRCDALYKTGVEGMSRASGLLAEDLPQVLLGQKQAAVLTDERPEAARLCSDYADVGAHVIAVHLTLGDRRRWREAALRAARQLEKPSTEAAHLVCLGNIKDEEGDHSAALSDYERARELSAGIGDDAGVGKALREAAIACLNRGDAEGALAYLTTFPDTYPDALVVIGDKAIDRRHEVTGVDDVRGLAHLALGDLERARGYLGRALARSRAEGDTLIEFQVLLDLALAQAGVGDEASARRRAEEATVLASRMADPVRGGHARYVLGAILSGEHPREAIDALTEAVDVFYRLGLLRREAPALAALGDLGVALEGLGELDRARRCFEQQIAIAKRYGDTHSETGGRLNLANLLIATGALDDALATYRELVPVARAGSDRLREADVLLNLGSALYMAGEADSAKENHSEALKIFRSAGAPVRRCAGARRLCRLLPRPRPCRSGGAGNRRPTRSAGEGSPRSCRRPASGSGTSRSRGLDGWREERR